MSAKSIDWVQGPWSVQLHTVSRSSYTSLHIPDCIFPNWIISFVLEGDVTTHTGGETHRVRAGDVMLHPPNLPFTESAEAAGTHLWMQSTIICSHHFDLFQLYRISPVVSIPDKHRYESTFLKLLSIWNSSDQSFRDIKLTSCVMQLTEQILSGWDKAGRPERSEAYHTQRDRFARLIGQMSARLADKLTREDLAAFVRLNANYLDRAFQQQYGLTPMKMLRDMRLQRARQLLERTEDPLEAIALQCGMTDASYLIKQFKKQYGVLPGEYREAVRRSHSEDLYAAKQR